jgi:hypothetical protein
VIAATLPKMGIVRNAARKVVFGTAKYRGLGIDHLATIQNYSRLQYLIGHIRSKSITSKLIHQQLDYTQLKVGCSAHSVKISLDTAKIFYVRIGLQQSGNRYTPAWLQLPLILNGYPSQHEF